uniref:J domain-containing protein n=1 Tax=viral metagenome TaxID=1070528 RepID=A0A6C0D3Y8_9ZZZZ
MKYIKSCKILGLSDIESSNITLEILKRQYRAKALQYHPDKNKASDAAAKFQEIHDAYEYLMLYQGFSQKNPDDDGNDVECDEEEPSDYQSFLMSFLKNIMKGETRSSLFYTIINRVVMTCEKTAFDTLSKLEKSTLIKTYEILKKYKDSLHFSESFIKNVGELIQEKTKDDECVILNPTINDLFENNLYKLTKDEKVYIIPLWHHELVYDHSGNDLYVKCNPMLPENIEIDENNNLHVQVTLKIRDIWEKPTINIELGKHIISVPPSTFKLVKKQMILYGKQGISKINSIDIYDIQRKSDIYLTIILEI